METTGTNARLKTLLALEAKQRLREEVFDELLAAGEEIVLSTYEPMIDAGEFNPNIYIVKYGLIRGTYLDKNMEKNRRFRSSGFIIDFLSLLLWRRTVVLPL